MRGPRGWRPPLLDLLSGAIVLVSICAPLAAGPQPSPRPTRRFVQAARKVIGELAPGQARLLTRAEDSVVVVFVPGILGSRLRRSGDGKLVWGRGIPDPKDLRLQKTLPDPTITPEPLEDYEIVQAAWFGRQRSVRVDVYRRFLEDLHDWRDGIGSQRVFAYDWRLDVRDNASRLQDHLTTGDLAGKDVVLVAHSLGGVVTWLWQQQHYDPEKTKILHAFFVGAPLNGSCEMLRMLVKGYGESRSGEVGGVKEGLSWLFEKFALEDQLRSAAFTFPAAFQLLPPMSKGAPGSCLEYPGPTGRRSARYFSADWWSNRAARATIGDAWRDLGFATEGEFDAELTRVLKKAQGFREVYDLSVLRLPSVTFVYSAALPTTKKARINMQRGGRYGREVEFPLDDGFVDDGDGRVLATVARNDGFPQGERLELRGGELEHGTLPKHGSLLDRIAELLEALYAERAAAAFDEEPAVAKYLAAGGSTVPADAVLRQLGGQAADLAALQRLNAQVPAMGRALLENAKKAELAEQPAKAALMYSKVSASATDLGIGGVTGIEDKPDELFGFYLGELEPLQVDDSGQKRMSPAFATAVGDYQRREGLEPSGRVDLETLAHAAGAPLADYFLSGAIQPSREHAFSVPVTFHDGKGRPTDAPTISDMHLFENGRQRSVVRAVPERRAINLALVVDTSSNVRVALRASLAEAVGSFLRRLRPSRYSIRTTGERPLSVLKLTSDLSAGRRALGEVFGRGGNCLFDAMHEAVRDFDGQKGERRILVAITGLGPEVSARAGAQIIEKVEAHVDSLMAVSFDVSEDGGRIPFLEEPRRPREDLDPGQNVPLVGSDDGREAFDRRAEYDRVLGELAHRTGGAYVKLLSEMGVDAALQRHADDLRLQVSVTYASHAELRNRRVRLRMPRAGLTARAGRPVREDAQ